MGRFIGKKFGLAGYSIEETSLCVLVVISSPPEAGCRDLLSRDHVSTSAVEPFRSGMQSVKWRAGCFRSDSRRLVQSTAGDRHGGGDANRLNFLTPNFCRVGEGELVILERRISSRACNSIEVTK